MGRELDFDRLKGSENFHTWKFAMENFLALKELGDCIIHKLDTPTTTGTSEVIHAVDVAKESEQKKLNSAKAYLVMGVETSIYIHIQSCTTALDIWNTLRRLYQDKGLTRKIALLKNLLSNKLSDSDGMQDYVDKIVSSSHKLAGVGFPVNDEWLGSIL